MHYYARRENNYNYKKNFGFGLADFPIVLYSYPSYLGVDILTASGLPDSLLGFTNGRSIVIKDGIKDIEDFVILHEEEHVKDMSASELETDKRALKKLVARKVSEERLEEILHLLEKRWKISISEPSTFLQ